MAKSYILRDYARKSDTGLGDFAIHVGTCMLTCTFLTGCPVTGDIVKQKGADLNTATAACKDGTKKDTEHKNTVRADLLATLDVVSNFVEMTVQGNREMMLATGFQVGTGSTRKLRTVGGTAILGVTNPASGKLKLKLLPSPGARACQVEICDETGVFKHKEIFTDLRDVVLEELVPGQLYGIRARLIGAKNQRGEWCEPVTHRAT